MSEEDHATMIAQFQDVTGQDVEKSKFYLESSGWDVELALGSFYEAEAIDTLGNLDDEYLKSDEISSFVILINLVK